MSSLLWISRVGESSGAQDAHIRLTHFERLEHPCVRASGTVDVMRASAHEPLSAGVRGCPAASRAQDGTAFGQADTQRAQLGERSARLTGRRVVVPDLYGGATAATVADAEALAEATLEDPAALALVERCADGLAAEGAPWAAVGFSMGAFLACHLAARGAAAPDELVLFYGGQPPQGTDVRTRRADLHVVPDDPLVRGR